MAQMFTTNETVVTQKICSNCTWMKGISSYLHPFFLFIRAKKKTNNCGLHFASHDKNDQMDLLTETVVKQIFKDLEHV